MVYKEKKQECMRSSQLLIAAIVIHETLHAYINYNIAIAQHNYNNSSNWMMDLNNFYLMCNLPPNYSNHTMILEDYFEKSIAVLQAWNAKQDFIYSTKDMVRAILTIVSILFTSNIYSQEFKKHDPGLFYVLSINARINNGDKKLPKSIIINNAIFNSLNELKTVSYSRKLDSIFKKVNWDLSRNKDDDVRKTKLIKAKKIVSYLKNAPIIYKGSDWSLEISRVIFSKDENEAVMAMRTSSKTEILDLTVYYFEVKNGQWILSKELSPFLF